MGVGRNQGDDGGRTWGSTSSQKPIAFFEIEALPRIGVKNVSPLSVKS